jgi:SnoaL-like domain
MLRRHCAVVVMTCGVAIFGPVAGHAQQSATAPAGRPMTLTALDYVEIQQLATRYPFVIDVCTNGGNDYADLYTDDGEFSVSQEWGKAGARKTKGRSALIKAAGGDGQGGCVDPKTTMGYGISHLSINHVITPTADGAIGKSYLLAIGVGGNPTTIERQGGYEDVYVKTDKGWRFKSRVHVFPDSAHSVQMSSRARGRASQPSGDGSTPAQSAPQSTTPR